MESDLQTLLIFLALILHEGYCNLSGLVEVELETAERPQGCSDWLALGLQTPAPHWHLERLLNDVGSLDWYFLVPPEHGLC